MEAGQLGAQNKAASEKQGKMPSIPRKKSKKTRPKPPAPDPAILPKRGIEDPEVILPYKKMTRQEAADAFEKIVKAKELEDAFATIGEELLKNKNIDEPRLVFRYMAKRLRSYLTRYLFSLQPFRLAVQILFFPEPSRRRNLNQSSQSTNL